MNPKSTLIAIAPLLTGAVIAGCGSTSKSGASGSASPAASGTASSASASAPASGGAYGSYGSSTSSSTSGGKSAKPVALITTKHAKLGTILAYGSKEMTVYLFEADKGGTSSCTGSCAQVWPPVLGAPKASGQAQSGDLGTIKRSDGTTQVTYKGHPLYRFLKDKDDGDAYGEGLQSFGAAWYVLKPSGAKLDNS